MRLWAATPSRFSWDGKNCTAWNSSGAAQPPGTPSTSRTKYGADNGLANRPIRGWDAVTVPGMVAGWLALHRSSASCCSEDLMEPAIEIAERGYAVPPCGGAQVGPAVPDLKNQLGFADTFMPHGRAPNVGEKFVFKAAADTLRKIGATKGRAY